MIQYPLYVTIDTNAFDECKYNFSENSSLQRLKKLVKLGKIRVVLSNVVVEECKIHIRENAREVSNQFKRTINRTTYIFPQEMDR